MRANLILVLSVLLFCPRALARSLPSPPAQPQSGPGGAVYKYAKVVANKYDSDDLEYWLFEPASPTPAVAPVVIFNHGWAAMIPVVYAAWIEHIVRRGNIVIYPRYQADLTTDPDSFTSNACRAARNALTRLQKDPGHVRPQLNMIATVGHSAGGQIAAGIASKASSFGLPPMRAVMCVQPGKTWGPRLLQIPLEDMSKIPRDTLLLTVAGDRDTIAGNIDAKRIINESIFVPPKNKNFITLMSDEHGFPPLIANHFCPNAPKARANLSPDIAPQTPETDPMHPLSGPLRERINERLMDKAASHGDRGTTSGATAQRRALDALDYFGLWKLFDALEDAAFYGKNRRYALGNTPEQRFMGKWSDGVAVKEMIVR